MGSELSEAREKQLLQAIHEVAKPDQEQQRRLDETRKRNAEEADGQDDKGEAEEKGRGVEKSGVFQAVGDLVSQSALSVKEAVLGKDGTRESDHAATHGSTFLNQSLDPKEESAQESLLVHTVVHD